MKLAIATRADSDIKAMTDLTFPVIKEFCQKWCAEFVVLNQKPLIMSDDQRPHFRILELYKLLDQYDRVISLDADVLITKQCPNLFDVVPCNLIGTIYEDKGTRQENRRSKIRNAQKLFGDVGWEEGYINTGVFVVSKLHRDIFTSIDGKYYTADGSDDVHIGYQIHKLHFLVQELDYRYNHMTMFSEPWNPENKNRYNSFIIHYAGAGIFDADCKTRNEQITKDFSLTWG
jgi:lipopolysaccharide biosynthesis glycosyltransferase